MQTPRADNQDIQGADDNQPEQIDAL